MTTAVLMASSAACNRKARLTHRRSETALVIRPPAIAPKTNAISATEERPIESPPAPAKAKPRSTTLPVMLAVNTRSERKLTASTTPVTAVIASRIAGDTAGDSLIVSRTSPSLSRDQQHESHFQTVSSEFVPHPKLCVVDVPAWRSLFEKLAGEKDSVVGLKPEVTIDLPSHLDTRPIADEPCAAAVGGNDQKSRNSVHSIAQTLPPLHNQVRRNGDAVRKLRLEPRMHVDEIDRSGASIGEHSEIIAD